MAQTSGVDDPSTDIVYDSQEEVDAWPESQPSNEAEEAAASLAVNQRTIIDFDNRPRSVYSTYLVS